MEKIQIQGPGSGINILDLIFKNLQSISFLGKKYLNSFMWIRIQDPELSTLDPGWKIGPGDLDPG